MGSCNNLDADFWSWMLDDGFCIIGLYRLDSTSAAGIDGVVVIYKTEYTLPHSSHANNEQCIGGRGKVQTARIYTSSDKI
jgi:hypothetical protein